MSTFSDFKIGGGTLGIIQYKNDIANKKIAGGVYNLGTISGYRDFNINNNYLRYNGSFTGNNLGDKYSIPTELIPIIRTGAQNIENEGPISDVGGITGNTIGNQSFYKAIDNNWAISSLVGSFNRYILGNSILEGLGSFYFKIDDYIYNRMEFSPKRLYNFLNGIYEYTNAYVYADNGIRVRDNIYLNNPYLPNEYLSYFSNISVPEGDEIFSQYSIQEKTHKSNFKTIENYYEDKKEEIYSNKSDTFINSIINSNSAIKIGDYYQFLCDNDSEIREGTTDYNNGASSYVREYGLKIFTEYKSYYDAIKKKKENTFGIEKEDDIDIYSVNSLNKNGDEINITLSEDDYLQDMVKATSNGVVRTLYNEGSTEPINIGTESHAFNEESFTVIQPLNSNDTINGILKNTNRLFSESRINTIINRFHTSKNGKSPSQIESAIDSVYGLSRGRNLRKADNKVDINGGYTNPYCRVWTSHYQYSHLKDRIRPFVNDNGGFVGISELQKKYGGLRTTDGANRLEQNSVLQKNGYVKISSSKDENNQFDNIKNYMFSIENLAWRGDDIDLSKNLSKEQIGPNNGRIMWFPPYNLNFSDNVNVNWNANEFIGRGEKIYTYTDTERIGTLSFTLLIDHPSVVNKWREESNADNSDIYEKEQELLRFFAGCDDLSNGLKENATPQKQENEEEPSTELLPSISTWDVIYLIFFPNNFSGYDFSDVNSLINSLKEYDAENWEGSDKSYEDQILDKRNEINTISNYNLNNVENGEWECRDEILKELGIEESERVYSLYDLTNENALSELFGTSGNAVNNNYKIESVIIKGCASSHGTETLNEELCKRRAASAAMIVKNQFSINDDIIREDEGDILEIKKQLNYDDVNLLSAKIARCAIIKIQIKLNSLTSPMNDANSETINNLNEKIKNSRVNIDNIEYAYSQDTTGNLSSFIAQDGTKIETLITEGSIAPAIITATRYSNSGDTFEEQSNEKYKYDDEYLYFSNLTDTDNLSYKNIIKQIKYFNPAFHSVTPEGFNARLTFLHQCTRQGPTQSIADSDRSQTAGNLSFGRAPYCILRIGDFFNTKIIIDNLSIDYKNGDGVQWDLNPEGIGVQPMMANISINFRFLGGQDIAGPIARLQNAVSYNYYANTSIYDRHSDYGDYTYDAISATKNKNNK